MKFSEEALSRKSLFKHTDFLCLFSPSLPTFPYKWSLKGGCFREAAEAHIHMDSRPQDPAGMLLHASTQGPRGCLAQDAPEAGQAPLCLVASLLQPEEQLPCQPQVPGHCHHGYLLITAQSPLLRGAGAQHSFAQAVQGLLEGANLPKNLFPVAGWRQEPESVWPNSHNKHGAGVGCSQRRNCGETEKEQLKLKTRAGKTWGRDESMGMRET